MTSTTEHPDAERLRAAIESIQRFANDFLPDQLELETTEELLRGYLRLQEDAPDLATREKISSAYAHGFLLGAQFQAAGGHREGL